MKLSGAIHQRNQVFPEKVLQFGTGVLLRGLCDFIIDSANKQGLFEGSIVIVKSTPGSTSDFEEQDNLYTACVRGLEKGVMVSQNIICEAISRVLSAQTEWSEILKTAHNPAISVVISNTTEVGIQYTKEALLEKDAPESFPGKLTAWLYERFKAGQAGVAIVPTELIVDNGKILKGMVLQHIADQQLGDDFKSWIEKENDFCSSLVDRIIPGKPKGEELAKLTADLGYEDDLMLKAEVYKLWAIEGGERVRKRLSFAEADKGVVISKDIMKYRELKLRLLNAPHTIMSGLCFLSGFNTVKAALSDPLMEKFFTILMLTELAPAMPDTLESKVVQRYGRDILDRFRNPFLEHQWHSITLQFTMKLKMRAIPLLHHYYEVFESVPHYFVRGISAYLLFMKSVKEENGVYYGDNKGELYAINDDQAAWYHETWKSEDPYAVTKAALSNVDFWGSDLTELPGLEENVANHLSNMIHLGPREVASNLNVFA